VRELPDLANRFAYHPIAFLATEGASKFDHVRTWAVRAESWQRMRVGISPELRRLRPHIDGPNLGPSQEEALVRRETAGVGILRLPLQVLLVGRIGDGQATEVGDALTFYKFAVSVQVAIDDITAQDN
jgi:hypothetical protein